MENNDIMALWKSNDEKLEKVLVINKQIAYDLTRSKLNRNILSMIWPKSGMLLIGIPYTLVLGLITFVASQAGAYLVMLGFGIITSIMFATIIGYIYQLFLISGISKTQEIVDVQKQLANLRLASYNIARLAVVQLPFWVICWMSLDALHDSPFLYGGINLVIIIAFTYAAMRIYKELDPQKPTSKINQLFFAGREWEPIQRASDIIEQLKEYEIDVDRSAGA
jgi:hypothetical protein